MILFSAEAILTSSSSKFGIEIPRTDDEDLNSSTTNSSSLIHCIASVGNCEQIHTSVLNLIFQQEKVAGIKNLSKWRSEICCRCWSAPQFFEESPPLKTTESFAYDQTGISDPDFVLVSFTFLRCGHVNRFLNSFLSSKESSILEDKKLKRKLVDSQKRFLLYRMHPKYLAANLCVAAIRMKA